MPVDAGWRSVAVLAYLPVAADWHSENIKGKVIRKYGN